MAMTKETQREAAKRIMAKMGPMSPEEQATYDRLRRSPEEYEVPKPGTRTCQVCGAEFEDIPATKENPGVPALEQFSDHVASHNPSPQQWGEAHSRIQAGKERQKGSTKDQPTE